ncbi:FxsA family membrane protein [Streptomyces caatingaensis]|uniref:Membrane protein n=1 Tax=Streptomyces caatingaensis TaxID=1678637 RepID=A0A0K9X9R9_9ACTN|nr:FxsA family membrane protein [Streptomyces caatingaensis]KNB49963.1 membrane protein [Streptomyces caatingaensis]
MTFGTPQQPATSRRPLRGGPRKLIPLAIAVWAVLEIWLLILVGDAAGGWAVFALLVAGVVAGSYVIKRAGRRAWRRLSESLQGPGAPAAPAAEEGGGNALTMLGGLLLMVPGLLSDAAGLLCLFPPTRSAIRRAVGRRLERSAGARAFAQARMRTADGKVVQGEVIRDDERPSPPRADDPQLPR